MAYLSDRMRTLAAIGCPQAAELLEKADELDKALAKDPSDLTTVLGACARERALTTDQALSERLNVNEDGKGPDLVENADRQSRPRLNASEAAADEFARDAAGQAIASSSADTAQDEPGQVAPNASEGCNPAAPAPPRQDGCFTCSRGRTRVIRRISLRGRW